MAFLIGGANSAADDAYEVANSCRFNNDDSDHMHKTPGSAGNRRTWTVSVWVKKSLVGGSTRKAIFGTADTEVNGDGGCLLRFENGDALKFESDGGQVTVVETNALYRDPSAWMHVVLAVDTTQGTAANRVKIYINGVQETSLATSTYPAQNKDYHWNNTVVNYVGAYDDSGDIAVPFDGYMAEFVSIDGSALTPSSFGEYNEDSPTIWQPIDVSGLTFGTNGFYLDFEDSANLGNDANGGTDLTEVNIAAIDQCVDTPTNNFATLNPLQTNTFDPGSTTFSEGNTKYVNAGSAAYNSMWLPTIGVTAGKWYGEFKLGTHSTSSGHSIGIMRVSGEPDLTGGDVPASDMIRIIFADTANVVLQFGSEVETSLGSCSSGDIFGLYFDADNGKLHCYKNNSAYITQITGMTIAGYTWYMQTQGEVQSTRNLTFEHNYGNPSFSISSSNADPNGYGSFEYSTTENSVDYYALCTKNLAEFG